MILTLQFDMIYWLFLVGYVIFVQQSNFSLADFPNVLVSSPNTSPFYRFPYKRSPSHYTCPLNPDRLNDEPLEIRSCGLLLNDEQQSKNISGFSNKSTLKKDSLAISIEQSTNVDGNMVYVRGSPPPSSLPSTSSQKISSQPPERPPIVTFDEWTKEKLRLEELKKNNQHRLPEQTNSASNGVYKLPSAQTSSENAGDYVATQQVLQPMTIEQQTTLRNYASKECGAKVLFSNDEAENRNAVLNEKEADDYMRNPCERAQNKWIIFELCETIQPTKLEIANFELFSSSPRDFRLLGSERYPSNDWVPLGDFVAEDTRKVQSFQVTGSHVYVKFIRMELLTHYGREHYCTLSLIRIFGVSIVDEYEAEAEAAAAPVAEPHQSPVPTPQVSEESPKVLEKSVNNENSASSSVSIPTVNGVVEEKQPQMPSNEESSATKQKDRHIVDAVVDVMGNIAIANIKNVLESAFLRGWKRKSPCVKCSGVSVEWMCKSCPAPNFPTVGLPFCRAFFGIGAGSKKLNSTELAKEDRRRTLEVRKPHSLPDAEELKVNYSSCRNGITEPQLKFLSAVLERTCPVSDFVAGNLENATSSLNASSFENSTFASSKPVKSDKQASLKLKGIVTQTLPGGVVSHKESVFLKLNKRINALELNMSLSSEYLSELSRRYVEKVNESEKQTEKTVKMAEAVALSAVQEVKADFESRLAKLSKDLEEIEKHLKFFTRNAFFPQSYAWRKTVALENDGVARSINEIPRSNFNKETNVLSASSELLYSNDHLWTTEQLIVMVIVAQVCTVVVMLLIQLCYNKKSWSEMHHLQKVFNDHITKDHTNTIGNNVLSQTSEKSSKRKRNKRRKLLLQNSVDEVGSNVPFLLSAADPHGYGNNEDIQDHIRDGCCGERTGIDNGMGDINISNDCKGNVKTDGFENNSSPLVSGGEKKRSLVNNESPLPLLTSEKLGSGTECDSLNNPRKGSLSADRYVPIQSLKADCAHENLKVSKEECPQELCHQKFIGSSCWNVVMKRRRHKVSAGSFKQA